MLLREYDSIANDTQEYARQQETPAVPVMIAEPADTESENDCAGVRRKYVELGRNRTVTHLN